MAIDTSEDYCGAFRDRGTGIDEVMVARGFCAAGQQQFFSTFHCGYLMQGIVSSHQGPPVRRVLRAITGVLCGWLLSGGSAAHAAAVDFDRDVAPLLAKRCLACHNSNERKGGLDLSSRKRALDGGESGPVIEPGKPRESLLLTRVTLNEMPPKQPLSKDEKQRLEQWLEEGAKWGTDPIDPFRYSSEQRAGYDWWSLQPVRRPAVPAVKQTAWSNHEIDRFILAKLEAQGLAPSPQADRRTLIRRLSFDLIGLPPTPEEVEAFVHDSRSDAYSRLVDRLLNSPHYGERWGRHWLDIVRFGESQGFERDKLRANGWYYRDWVIQALNKDLPYDQFIRLQVAGDVLEPHNPEAVIATGFLVCAPYDETGQVQQSAVMRAVVRQDELEDVVGVTGQTFLGLTVNCARCHDHKFDPITQREYYQLTAALAGVRHGEREAVTNEGASKAAEQRAQLAARGKQIDTALAALEQPAQDRLLAAKKTSPAPVVSLPEPVSRWDFSVDTMDLMTKSASTLQGTARTDNGRLVLDGQKGYLASAPLSRDIRERTLAVWVQLANLEQRGGGALSLQTTDGTIFDAIVFGERDAGHWMAGSNNFQRTQSFQGTAETEASKTPVCLVITYDAERNITAYRNGAPYGKPYQASTLVTFPAGKSQLVIGLRHSPAGSNKHLAGTVLKGALYDRALSAEQVAALAGTIPAVPSISEEELMAALTPEQRQQRRQLLFEKSRLQMQLHPWNAGKVYAVNPRPADPTHLLDRGNPQAKKDRVAAAGIKSLGGLTSDFGLAPDAPEADRRIRLAHWLSDPRNPLTPRTMMNRLWHYHFGTGIVDTPNDLGFNGGKPSHPELLDWLASEFVARQWSLKQMHRLIVTSATYQQASRPQPGAIKLDAQNRLLWRKAPWRLEAETLRDTVLHVTGELNPQMGGPGYRDFRTFTFNSQFYEMLDPVGREFQRRTVYRTWARSGRQEFLDVFDCPDPSTTAPKRAVTTTPLQALALLNNSFTLRMSERLAERIERDAGRDASAQITRLYQLCYQRPPSKEELKLATTFSTTHGLAALCRVILNSNEFLHIE